MEVQITLIVVGVVAALALLGLLARWLEDNPLGTLEAGVCYHAARVYAACVHSLRIRGRDRIPISRDNAGPLIIVCNHTAGIDPVLVQTACRFPIRWIMAEDMRHPALEWFWRQWRVIFVNRSQRDGGGLREATRHLKAGGVVGIFPEGGLERPPGQLLRFQGGVGLLIRRSKASVLAVTIDGTPQFDPAWASLWHTSRSIVHFRETIDYSDSGLDAAGISGDLEARFMRWLGWPMNEAPIEEQVAGVGSYGTRVESRSAAR